MYKGCTFKSHANNILQFFGPAGTKNQSGVFFHDNSLQCLFLYRILKEETLFCWDVRTVKYFAHSDPGDERLVCIFCINVMQITTVFMLAHANENDCSINCIEC